MTELMPDDASRDPRSADELCDAPPGRHASGAMFGFGWAWGCAACRRVRLCAVPVALLPALDVRFRPARTRPRARATVAGSD